MASSQHSVNLQGIKVAVATPCYGNQVTVEYMRSLMTTCMAFQKHGVEVSLLTVTNDSLLPKARNAIVDAFLKTGCDYLFSIDADMGWAAEDAVRLLAGARLGRHGIVGAAGRRKIDSLSFCARLIADSVHPITGLLEAETVGTAFLMIERRVLQDLWADDLAKGNCYLFGEAPIANVFECIVDGQHYWSEDYVFCRKYRALGGKIYVDPNINLDHIGNKAWSGRLSEAIQPLREYFPTFITEDGYGQLQKGRETRAEAQETHEPKGAQGD